jgi:nitrite reductase (NADH) small subunit
MWTRITAVESIPVREGRSIELADREIAIFNLGGRFAAIDAQCPHRGGPLCDGIVTGGQLKGHAVVCPLHGWKIDLDSGAVLKPDVSVRVETYDVRVDGGIIEVDIPSARKRAA